MSADAAHADHKHAIATAAASAIVAGQGSGVGTSTALSKSDHQHDATQLVGTADSRLNNDRVASGLRTQGGVVDTTAGAAATAGSLLAASTTNVASFVTPASLGIIRGPASTTTGNLASFLDASGDWVSDTGIAASTLITSAATPITSVLTFTGTAETVLTPVRVTVPANRMTIGHTVRWTLVLIQSAFNTTTPTTTFKVRYGTTGTSTDAQVAQLVFAAATTLLTNPQKVEIIHTVRGPLAASCAAYTTALAYKGSGAGMGGASAVTTATPTMNTFTCAPASLNYWTLTAANGNTTLAYQIQQSTVEMIVW